MNEAIDLARQKKLPFRVNRGQEIDFSISVNNADGTPYDFTNHVGELYIYNSFSKTDTPEYTITVALSSGTIAFTHVPITRKKEDFVYKLWITNAAGYRQIWTNGAFLNLDREWDHENGEDTIIISPDGDAITLTITPLGGGSGGGTWGTISGILSDQIDLQAALNAKAESFADLTGLPSDNPALLAALDLKADDTDLDLKQTGITFKDEGVALGAANTVDDLDFLGAGVTAARVGNKVSVTIPGGGGGGTVASFAEALAGTNDTAFMSPLKSGYVHARVYNVKAYGAVGDGVTDDTPEIQAAIQACFDAGGGVVYFPNGIYIIGGALVTNVSGQNPNCQLYIPQQEPTSTTRKSIVFMGESKPNKLRSFGSGGTIPTGGVILKSTILGANTRPAVIGSVRSTADAFNYCGFYMQNITVRTRTKTAGSDIAASMTAVNMYHNYTFAAEDCVADIETIAYNSVEPTDATVSGFILPAINNSNVDNRLVGCVATGYYNGFLNSDHATLISCWATACRYGYQASTSSTSTPTTIINSLSSHCKYNLVWTGVNTVSAINFKIENSTDNTRWFYNTADFYAPSNVVSHGSVWYAMPADAVFSPTTAVGWGNVFFNNLKGSPKALVAGGRAYPHYGGTGEWDGLINASGHGVFEIGTAGVTSNGEDGKVAVFQQSHRQQGTGAVCTHRILNDFIATAEKRLWVENYSTTATGTQAGKVTEFLGNNSGVSQVTERTSDYYKFLRPLILDNDISPTALAANTDNYAPTNIAIAATLRISASSAVDLTGIAGGVTMVDGRELTLINVGTTNTITLKSDVTSTAANRFLLNADFALAANMAVKLVYDGTSQRWRKIY